jgi:transcriptional regulator with XRE-family HTH domain
MVETSFASRLKELRLARGVSQGTLGAAVGIKAQAVNDMEHGRIKTTLDRAAAIADYFGVSLDYLVGRSDEPALR